MLAKLKTLASDTAIYGLFTIIGRFLTFLLTPFYSNFLTQNQINDVITIFAILAFLNVIYSIGMESSFFRFYEKDNFKRNKIVFSHSYLTIAIISLSFTLLFFFTANFSSNTFLMSSKDPSIIYLAAAIPFLDALILIPFGLLRMKRKSIRFSLIKFIQIIIVVSLNVYFVMKLDLGTKGVMIAQLIASTLGVILLLPEIFKFFHFKIDFKLLKEMLIFGIPTMPANLSAIILQVADRPILNALAPDKLVTYGINYRLSIPMMLFVTVFEYAWKPFYLSNHKEKNAKDLYARVLTYFSLVSAAIFIIVSFYIEFIVRLPFVGGKFINPAYWGGMHIIPIILVGYYFNGLYTNFAAGFLITKKTKYLPLAIIIAAIVNLVLNFSLIPIIGYEAAAWATLGSYFTSALILYLISRKIYPIRYEWKRIFTLIIITLIIFLSVNYFSSEFNLLNRFILKTAGIIILLILLKIFGFFTKEEIKSIKNFFTRKKLN